ncbi:hypothetical protein OROHE_001962 [Orobanche hederae]
MAEERKFSHTHTRSTHPHTPAALDRDERRGGPNFMRRPGRCGDFRCGRRDGCDPKPMRMRAPIQVLFGGTAEILDAKHASGRTDLKFDGSGERHPAVTTSVFRRLR